MSWFERYGVVGAYFFIISSFWVLGLSYFTKGLTEKFIIIAVSFASSLLPLGYLLATLSQLFYYKFSKNAIHRRIISLFDKSDLDKLGLTKNDNEAICESRLTACLRLKKAGGIELESLKYLAKFITPRFYVLAVNNSLILSTLLAPIIPIVAIKYFAIFEFKPKLALLRVILLFSIVIIIFLRKSNKVLENQILEIHKVIWDKESNLKMGCRYCDLSYCIVIIYMISIVLYTLNLK